jgi:DNA primase
MSTIDEIKSRIDIVDLVSEAGVKLRHAGKNYTGLCPFHDNKKTPAFVVWPESGTWRCFGQCNEGGDIFKFVMKRENLDFKEAMQKLAARAGVEIKEYQKETPQQKEVYEHLRKLLEDAVVFYRSQLFANKEILTYLREKRGLTDSTTETFGLGYAPAGYDHALKHFIQRGYKEQELIDVGLLTEREDGKRYDKFRNRIMIPIRDEQGRMAGFGARIVDPNDIPKFLNSPETPVFSKGRLLYGLDRARKPIRTADQAVIVEGYLDVIALHQAGYENVVSPMGTALTEDQLRLLKRLTRKIVLALDPDTAGKVAVLRGLETARQSISDKVPLFNREESGEKGVGAPELLKFSDQLQVEIKVVALPDDLDPDELVQRGKEEWTKLIDSAEPIVLHTIKSVVAKYDLNNPKDKTKIVDELMPFISNVSNSVERDDYRQRLARMLRVDERSLIGIQVQGPRVRRPRGVSKESVQERRTEPANISVKATVTVSSSKKVEEYVIGVLFNKPEMLYRLDRLLQEYGLTALDAQDFDYTDHKLLFGLIRESVEQYKTEHHEFVVDALPESLQVRSRELVKETEKIERLEERLMEELLRGVIKLRRVAAGENLNQLRFLQEEAQQGEDSRATSYQELVLQNTRLLRDLDQAFRKMSMKRLV